MPDYTKRVELRDKAAQQDFDKAKQAFDEAEEFRKFEHLVRTGYYGDDVIVELGLLAAFRQSFAIPKPDPT